MGLGEDTSRPLAARPAAGIASGALDGRYPSPSMGAPAASSWAVSEHWLGDFLKAFPVSANAYRVTDIAGGCTPTIVVAGASTERGVMRLATGAGALDGGTVALPQPTYAGVDEGTLWVCKNRIYNTNTQIIAWSGFSSGMGSTPAVATAMSFVGIRLIAAGAAANWYGVAKNGAASETTLDLGVAGDSTFRILAFRKLASSIVFYTGNASDRDRGLVLTEVGSITATIPTAALYPVAVGCLATSASQRNLEQDFFTIGGSIAT